MCCWDGFVGTITDSFLARERNDYFVPLFILFKMRVGWQDSFEWQDGQYPGQIPIKNVDSFPSGHP